MSKVTSLADAVKTISSGSHVSLSGFVITRCVMAFAAEVIRQGIHELTLSQCVGAMDADMLVGAGAVRRLIYGGGSLDRFGRLANINRAIEDGSIIAEEYSSLSVSFRYLAGSLGLPFMPIRSLRGSDLLKKIETISGSSVAHIEDPFTGNDWLVLQPLIPDVAIVQVQCCDEEGNAWILGPRWDNVEQAKASHRTILITEHVVSSDTIRHNPERTVIPGLLVSHVVELPYSAHPCSVYGEYDYDSDHIKIYAEANKAAKTFQEYLSRYVLGVKNHQDYLETIGGSKKLSELQADLKLGY
jgi:acyl CoA:acetate/3-ketoacid CoA transferase alpha subunit